MQKSTLSRIAGLFVFLLIGQAAAGEFKFRAREHFASHQITLKDGSESTYQGLSNTINLWWEEPRRYSLGLALNPLLGSAKVKGAQDARLGNEVKLITFGLEGKYYHRDIADNLFSRLGVGYARLNHNGSAADLEGYHVYLGAGWEFEVKGVGIALELAFRHSGLEQDAVVKSITPSLGVHFYR
ncbi:MAG: hypothetical protein Q9O24_04170 [Gammaproteobacteria bacterium]|nr:hypothetical protein [Gammaproteobacteria bacterium]